MDNQNHTNWKKGDKIIFKLNPYKILEVFPLGQQGVVYKIVDWHNKNQFALKIVNEMSEKEMEITKWLQKNHHTNIVNILDIDIRNQRVFILMECCEINLYEQINEKVLDQKELRYFMISIARGLQYLHSNQIIHRDLKPENILVATLTDKNNKELKQRVYKIADFGLSLQQQRAQTKYIGTCYYMAPELLNNLDQPYDNKVDIWSFGTIVYELLKGKTLITGFTIQQIFCQIQNLDKAENQNYLNEKLKIIKDEFYFELVSNMLKYDPNERYGIDQVIRKIQQNKDQDIVRYRSSSCNEAATTNQQLKKTQNSPIKYQLLIFPQQKQQIKNYNAQLQFKQNNQIQFNYWLNQKK